MLGVNGDGFVKQGHPRTVVLRFDLCDATTKLRCDRDPRTPRFEADDLSHAVPARKWLPD